MQTNRKAESVLAAMEWQAIGEPSGLNTRMRFSAPIGAFEQFSEPDMP